MKNKFQTWFQWITGQWTCPKCLKTWITVGIFDDFVLRTYDRGGCCEKRLACVCGFELLLWSRPPIHRERWLKGL